MDMELLDVINYINEVSEYSPNEMLSLETDKKEYFRNGLREVGEWMFRQDPNIEISEEDWRLLSLKSRTNLLSGGLAFLAPYIVS